MLSDYCIRIKVLENGFMVEVPDMDAIAAKQKAAAKDKSNPSVYTGDCTESYAAKSVSEVVALVKKALTKIPDVEYDESFKEAAAKAD
jgi:hypothetical protein